MKIIALKDAISKAYKRTTINKSDIENFRTCLSSYLNNVDASEHEDNMEGYQRDFLKDTFYKKYDITKPDNNNIDCAIRLNHSTDSPIAVIIENKKPSNTKEMITEDDPNRKAMQELVYYYLIERIENKNTDVRHLIATNMYDMFIFDATMFEKLFYGNNNLCREFRDFREKKKPGKTTDEFYEIASRYIAEAASELECVHVNLVDYKNVAESKDDRGLRKLTTLYKLFSDTYMMKLPVKKDYNTLDTGFYRELLYIIGLEEVKDKGKPVLKKIDSTETQASSLIDLTMNFVEKKLYDFDKRKYYGTNTEEQLFNISLELCITWIDRLLFLRLLESQIVKYHGGDENYRILGNDRITSFQKLNTLFFDVLAVDYSKRKDFVNNSLFGNVPYLNSSLFELTYLENRIVTISALPNDVKLPITKGSVLHKEGNAYRKQVELPTLQYLLAFLDSYRFAGQEEGEIEDSGATLINASVLGLIFEKINGHKDGAVFTPAFITSSMSRPAVERAIIRKFNQVYEWNCSSITDLANSIDRAIDRGKITIADANAVFNSVRIADISVGSGHFIVSVLGQMIRLKFELGILVDPNGKMISKREYDIDIINDELSIMTVEDGAPFRYIPGNNGTQNIQEAIFNEKQAIIESCLFGVDISSNSVGICRLRLWIELLKNTYYTKESNYEHLRTLPNLDINIKQGDSLLSRYRTDVRLNAIFQRTKIKISDYKKLVKDYKMTSDKVVKHQIEEKIKIIKSHMDNGLDVDNPIYKELVKANRKLLDLKDNINFCLLENTTESLKQAQKLQKDYDKMTDDVANLRIKYNDDKKKFVGSFEWRFEFPEILDDEGKYIGFDLIIGNPPYIQLQADGGLLANTYGGRRYNTFKRSGDIYCLFIERSCQLLADGGQLSLITSNKWLKAGYGKATREFVEKHLNPSLLLDFGANNVFENANVLTDILVATKDSNDYKTRAAIVPTVDYSELPKALDIAIDNASLQAFRGNEAWLIADPIAKNIKEKMEKAGKTLIDKGFRLNRGILTGRNDVFIISTEKRNEILSSCKDNEERDATERAFRKIIRGEDISKNKVKWDNKWVIYIPWHFPLENDKDIKGASDEAESSFVLLYPTLYEYLLHHKKELGERNKSETDIRYEWYALQRWGAKYYKDFNEDKIVWGNLNLKASYAMDTEKCIVNAPANQIVPASRALLNLLNSNLADWYIRQLGVTRNGGYFEYKPMFVGQLPIPEDISSLEYLDGDDRINKEVFNLYGLSNEEVKYIQSKED